MLALGVSWLSSSLQAQTSATLNVSVRVVEQCVITTALKRRLAQLVRQGRHVDFQQYCSKGVRSTVDERTVDRSIVTPSTPISSPTVTRRLVAKQRGESSPDIVLVTVSY